MEEQQHSRKIGQIIETGMKYATYLFLFFVLTGIKKGGDMRLFIPYITVMFLIAHIAVSRDFSVLRMALFNALACYVVLSYVLVLFSFSPRISLTALNRDVLPGMFLFLAIHFRSDAAEKVRELLFVFVAALAVVVAGGYFSYIRRYLAEGSGGHLSPDIPFLKFKLYFNVFAMKVNFLLPFAVACTAMLRTNAARYMLWVLIAASAGAVLLSLSRGGWISLLAIFFFFSFFLSRGRLKLSHAIAASSLFLVIFCTVVWLVFPTVRQRILATSSDEIGTVNLRTRIWQHYISAVKEKPLTGWGYGDRIIWDNGPVVLTKESEHEVPEQFRIGMHNTVLFVLYHQGIIGLAGYLAFVATGFVALLKTLNIRSSSNAVYLFSLFAALISMLFIHSIIESVSFFVPCIIFGFLSGVQQWDSRRNKAACLPQAS